MTGPTASRSVVDYYQQVSEAAAAVHAQMGTLPEVAVVLGSGLGDFAGTLGGSTAMSYDTLPHWPASRVIGHAGRLVIGQMGPKRVLALAGRCHAYEGHDLRTVTFAMRVLGLLGIRTVILTNAAGGINHSFTAGDLMIIDDHINLTGNNPLVGENDERFGLRFPDMTAVYTPRLRDIADTAAAAQRLTVRHGVYAALLGPSYETPAEIRYLRAVGADAVGMSTAAEAIVARHMGMDVLGISCISNMAAGVLPQPLRHEEVMETAYRVRGEFISLLEGIIARL